MLESIAHFHLYLIHLINTKIDHALPELSIQALWSGPPLAWCPLLVSYTLFLIQWSAAAACLCTPLWTKKKKKWRIYINAHNELWFTTNKSRVNWFLKTSTCQMCSYLDAAASATALAAVASSNFFRFFSSASCFSAVARASCSALSLFSSWPTACLSFCFACTALWSLQEHGHTQTLTSR